MSKLAAEAKKYALSQKRVERLADIGQAQHQPVSRRNNVAVKVASNGWNVLVDTDTGQEIYTWPQPTEAEAAAEKRLLADMFGRQPVSIEVMEVAEEEIARLRKRVAELEQYNGEKDERVRELGNCNVDLNRQIDGLEQQNENQAQTIRVLTEKVGRLEARIERQAEMLEEEECRTALAQALTRVLVNMPPQAPTSPKEPPLAPETANVPGEAVGVHPVPNVTIAGGE